jgi:hypothetical protein
MRHNISKKHLKTNVENDSKSQSAQLCPILPNLPIFCKNCKKEFKRMYHLNRHLEKCKIENNENIVITNEETVDSTLFQNSVCQYCNKEYTNLGNMKKHQKKCKHKKLQDAYELRLEIKDEEIMELKLKLAKYEGNIETYKEERERQYKLIENQKSTLEFIKSCFGSAPLLCNSTFNVPGLAISEAVKMGAIEGGAHLLNHALIKNTEPENRSIWCIDSSRNKYIYKAKSGWVLDSDGIQISDITMKEMYKHIDCYIKEKIKNMSNTNMDESSIEELNTLIGFSQDIINKKNVIKIFRKAAKRFVYIYDKEDDKEVSEEIKQIQDS